MLRFHFFRYVLPLLATADPIQREPAERFAHHSHGRLQAVHALPVGPCIFKCTLTKGAADTAQYPQRDLLRLCRRDYANVFINGIGQHVRQNALSALADAAAASPASVRSDAALTEGRKQGRLVRAGPLHAV